MRPIAQSDRHDGPGLVYELVPSLAGEIDDIVIALVDPVGEPVVSYVLPDVLDRVQFGRARWQGQEGGVLGDLQLSAGVPSGLVEDDKGVRPIADLRRDLIEMPLHGLRVAARQHESGADAALGTDGTEDIGRLGALVLRRPRSRPALGPPSGQLVLLADAGFILEPDLDGPVLWEPRLESCQLFGELFLNWS